MTYPGGCSSKTLIDTLTTNVATVDTVVDGIAVDTEILEDHAHSVQKVAPSLAAGVTVTANAGAWTLSTSTNIGTFTNNDSTGLPATGGNYDIHFIHVSEISGADQYQLNVYDDGTLVCAVPLYKKNINADDYVRIPVITTLIAANSTVTVKLASASGGQNAKVKLCFHQY